MSGQIRMTDSQTQIHPTAIIAKGARIGAGCRIGAYCVVGPEVSLGDGVVLENHVSIAGWTEIGPGCRIWPFASIGSDPQDLKFGGEHTRVEIGARTRIREYSTVNPGTNGGGGVTRIGDDNLIMMYVHVAHDCQIGNGIVLANAVQLAGHVVIGDNAILGGQSGVHQFCRVGKGAMIGAGAVVVNDVIPYGSVISARGVLGGLNLVGLRRRGAERAAMNGLRHAYKRLFMGTEGTLLERAQALQDEDVADNALVLDVLEFLLANSDRAFCAPE